MVVLEEARWAHIISGHDAMAEHLPDIEDTISRPHYREPDPRHAGRERLFRQNAGPERWLRVVIAFDGRYDSVVTAFGQSDDPRKS